jgi:hypothetical protein
MHCSSAHSLRIQAVSRPDNQQVYEILLKMLDRWNAHDIEGYMEVYWKSLELLVIIGSEDFDGWKIIASHTSITE